MKLGTIALCCLFVPSAAFANSEAAAETAQAPSQITAAQKEKPRRSDKIWPLFEGAEDATFAAWVSERLVYPENLTELPGASRETVTGFTVDENGAVSKIIYIENPLPVLSEQLQKVISGSPAWTPASRRKKAEATTYYLFVNPLLKEVRLVSERTGNYADPEFEGRGLVEFRRWVASNAVYPQEALIRNINGRVVMDIVVDKAGKAGYDKLVSTSGPMFTDAVVTSIDKAPSWTPATIDGVPIPVSFTLTIEFILGQAYGPGTLIR